jgi:glycerol-3-phosphate dehydrogenase (NAD(P)+)
VATGKITGFVTACENPRKPSLVLDHLGSERLLTTLARSTWASRSGVGKNEIAIPSASDALQGGQERDLRYNDRVHLLAAVLNEIQTLGRAVWATHPETYTS